MNVSTKVGYEDKELIFMQVHNMTIRAKGKILLENAHLSITAGRRYGLVGPNGKGKSTLLRMIARRQIPVPENLDVLLVEQVLSRFEGLVNTGDDVEGQPPVANANA